MSFLIANGTTTSNSIEHRTGSMTIFGPAALTNAVAVEVSVDGTTWNALVDLGTPVTVGVNEATTIQGNFGYVHMKSAGAEGADRTFQVLTTRSGLRRSVSTDVVVSPMVQNLDAGTFDISNAGTITATAFVGNITGDITGNVTGDVTGNITGTVTTVAAGPTITSGAGAPAAAEPDGSIYLRTGGAADSTLYTRTGGAWLAVDNV